MELNGIKRNIMEQKRRKWELFYLV